MNRFDLVKSLNPTRMAEIGVCEGVFSAELSTIRSIRELWLVDPWRHYPGSYESDPANVDQGGQDARHRRVVEKFLPQRGRVKILRMESLQAAKRFGDKSLDVVFLDANHSEESVYADLVAWSRPAKVLLCHDYTDSAEALAMGFGVKEAVERFCKEYGWTIKVVTTEEWPTCMLAKK